MKKLVAVAAVIAATTLAPTLSGTASASKNCPEGSHPGKGPDPTKVYCYDNFDPSELVKVFSA